MATQQHFEAAPIPPRSPLPFTGVSKRKRSIFYTQLARMLRAGISPVKSLTTLAGQGGSWRLSRAAGLMAAHIQDGGSLGSAFARHPNLFPPHEIRMIEAAELGGDAPDAMLRLARFLDQLVSAQRTLITGFIYPVLCLFLVFFVLPNVAWFIVPDVFPRVWPYQILAVVAAAVGGFVLAVVWRSMNQVSGIRLAVHGVLNCVPVVGAVVRKMAWTRFAHTLECLYSAGALVHEAIAVAARSCGNAVIASRILRVVPMVQAGGSVTEALTASGALPSLGIDMIAIGEHSGKLSEALLKFAEYQEDDVSTAIQRLSVVLVVLVILGYITLMAVLIIMVWTMVYGRILQI